MWFANRARFGSLERTGSDNYDLLLVIDAAAREAALLAGYGLEPFVSEANLEEALQTLAPLCRESDWVGGIRSFLQALIAKLSACALQVRVEREVIEEAY